MASRSPSKKSTRVKAYIGSGNVFADLGRPDADEALAKAQLAYEIGVLVESAGLTQAQAAKRLRIDQPKVSLLLRGKLGGFSIERLFRFLNDLGQDIEIKISPATRKHANVRVAGRTAA